MGKYSYHSWIISAEGSQSIHKLYLLWFQKHIWNDRNNGREVRRQRVVKTKINRIKLTKNVWQQKSQTLKAPALLFCSGLQCQTSFHSICSWIKELHTFLLAAPTLAFLVPRTFFILFLRSLRCFLEVFFFSNRPCWITQIIMHFLLPWANWLELPPK